MFLPIDPIHSSKLPTSTPAAPPPADWPPGGLSPRTLQRVQEFVETHLHQPLQLGDLAAAAGISRFHFARMFRLSTGQTPMRYLQCARIQRAKALLQRRERAICDIALGLGFYDQSHFTRSFRRVTGLSPTQFMRQNPSRSYAA